jgi:hypothetical protein
VGRLLFWQRPSTQAIPAIGADDVGRYDRRAGRSCSRSVSLTRSTFDLPPQARIVAQVDQSNASSRPFERVQHRGGTPLQRH